MMKARRKKPVCTGQELVPFRRPLHRECPESRLTQWPVQISWLCQAPYFRMPAILIATGCTALPMVISTMTL